MREAKGKARAEQLVTWAKESPRSNFNGRKCVVCKHPEVARIVADVVAARKRGAQTVSKTQLTRRLVEEFGWRGTYYSLRDHIDHHLGGWGGQA